MRRFLSSSAVVAVASVTALSIGGVSAVGKVPGSNGRIVFAREIPGLDGTVSFTIDPDGTDELRLRPGEVPHWSPDGSEVAVLACANPPDCTTASVIVDPDTGQIVRWFPFPDLDLFTACFVWSADGSRLACEGFSESDPDRNGIYSIDASDGNDLIRVTSNPGGGDVPGDYSPDGSRIVFLRTAPDRRDGRNQALFIARVGGAGTPRRLTRWGLSQETGSWSPDGTTILFAGNGTLYTVSVDRAKVRRIHLARRGAAFDPVWSPDGKKIAFGFYARGAQQSDIWIASANGFGMHRVTQTRRSEHFPDWGSHSKV